MNDRQTISASNSRQSQNNSPTDSKASRQNYTTDGKEVVNKFGDREFKSTVKWQDDNLVVNSKFNFNDTDITAVATWALAIDGRTLTINAHFSSSMGEADQKLLFEKQDSGALAAPAKNP